MATYTTTRGGPTFPVHSAAPAGILQAAVGVYNYATNLAAASIIEFCRVPPCTVIGGWVQASDLDTNETEELDFDIGWAANGAEAVDVDGFGNFGAQTGDASVHLPVAGIYMPFVNVIQHPGFKTFTKETTITGVINVDAATLTAGTMKVVVLYIVDPSFSA
jgi:hypothetical protein